MTQVTFVVNRNQLKVYRKPMTKQEFIHVLTHESDLDLVGEEATPLLLPK